MTISRRALWLAGLTLPAGLASADGTPEPLGAPPEEREYRAGAPTVLIGQRAHAVRLVVDALPTDRYGVITVANGSDGALTCSLETPDGNRRPIFSADGEDAWTGPLLLDRPGLFVLEVDADGPWAVIIR